MELNTLPSLSTLLVSLQQGILTITINRPDKMNALNRTVFQELEKVLDLVDEDKQIRAVVITGAGNKAFVAGADISEFTSLDQTAAKQLARHGQLVFERIEKNSKPFVAAVNGFALGGGCELAMACHIRIAVEQAKFGQPEVNLGLIPGYGGTQRLTQLVGKGKALELMMSGNMLTATEALQWGLVNHVCSAEEVIEKACQLLATITAKGPGAVSRVITAVNASFEKGIDGYSEEVRLFGECFGTDEMKEGVSAFLEKRKPNFN
jgi:enoyl-CoA hydratase